MATIILGGGIIGLSTAYYLALLEPELAVDHKIHIIDSASELFLSASGLAGGFLAKDWFSPTVSALGDLSFRLHKELADAYDGPKHWAYAPSITYSLAVEDQGIGERQDYDDGWLLEGTSRAGAVGTTTDGEERFPSGGGNKRDEMLNEDGSPAWFSRQNNGTLKVIDDRGGCAQIEPKQLCQWLLEQCEAKGVKVHTSCEAFAIVKNQNGKVTGMKVKKDTEIFEKHCKNILITAGAWTSHVFEKLFTESKLQIPIDQLAGYSIVVRSPRLTKPVLDPSRHAQGSVAGVSYAVFCAPISTWNCAPEAFSRVPADGRPELWAGGVNDSALSLPESADLVASLRNPAKSKELRSAMVAMTGLSKEGDDLKVDDLEIVRESLCFRPVSKTGTPILFKVPSASLGHDISLADDGGVYIASGHGPWGITMSLGTGQVMAELMTGRTPSADISALGLL